MSKTFIKYYILIFDYSLQLKSLIEIGRTQNNSNNGNSWMILPISRSLHVHAPLHRSTCRVSCQDFHYQPIQSNWCDLSVKVVYNTTTMQLCFFIYLRPITKRMTMPFSSSNFFLLSPSKIKLQTTISCLAKWKIKCTKIKEKLKNCDITDLVASKLHEPNLFVSC